MGLTLMMQNKEVLYVPNDSVEISVINPNLVPFILQDKLSWQTLNLWLAERAIPMCRDNAKSILTNAGCHRRDGYSIAIKSHTLSLQDSYWIKFDHEDLTWESVNLYTNEFDPIIEQIALCGTSISNSNTNSEKDLILSPELTTDGTYGKCWHREVDGIYLYKKDYKGYEVNAEVISSIIADKLQLDHIPYTWDTLYGVRCCKCKCFCNEDTAFMQVFGFNDSKQMGFTDWLNHPIIKRNQKSYLQMFLLDGLIGNVDRHYGNWGFLYNPHTNSDLKLAPLFDHNCAINPNSKSIDELPHSSFKNRTICDYARYSYQHLEEMESLIQKLCDWYYSSEAKKLFKSTYGRIDELTLLKLNLALVTKDKVKPTKRCFFSFLK